MYFSASHKYNIFETVNEPLTVVNTGRIYFEIHQKSAFTNRLDGLPNCQVLFIKTGLGIFNFDGEEVKIGGGNIIVFREDEPQIYRFVSDLTETFWVHFAGSEASKLLDKYDLTKRIIPINNAGIIEKRLRSIIDEISAKNPFFIDAANKKLEMLLIDIARNEATATNKWTVQAINNICDEMRINFGKTANSEYAQKCKMSLPYFMKTFKRVTGYSPQEFQTAQRIEVAKSMLVNTDYKISQVATNCGFDDPLYFSRCFKKHTGISPANYKRSSKL